MKRSSQLSLKLLLLGLLFSCGSEGERIRQCIHGCPKEEPEPTCTVQQAENGAVIQCPDGTQAIVMNGQSGERGQDGSAGKDGSNGKDAPPTKYTFTEIIDPCGKQGTFDEVLFKTASGEVIAFFSASGGFLTLLHNGNYVVTDGTGCEFTVLNGEIINEHN